MAAAASADYAAARPALCRHRSQPTEPRMNDPIARPRFSRLFHSTWLTAAVLAGCGGGDAGPDAETLAAAEPVRRQALQAGRGSAESTTEWKRIAIEGQAFRVVPRALVRYGAEGQ